MIDLENGVVGAFFAQGRPRTKGSMTPQLSKGKGGRLTVHLVESGTYSVPWKRQMIAAIRSQCNPQIAYTGPVIVNATFYYIAEGPTASFLPYPTLLTGVNANGDLDKLLRNLLDALTQSKLIADDSLVMRIIAEKRWCSRELRMMPGVDCVVSIP